MRAEQKHFILKKKTEGIEKYFYSALVFGLVNKTKYTKEVQVYNSTFLLFPISTSFSAIIYHSLILFICDLIKFFDKKKEQNKKKGRQMEM